MNLKMLLKSHSTKKAEKIIESSGLFDNKFYLLSYSDLLEGGVKPVNHFLNHGAKEYRNPSVYFDTQFYLNEYEDVSQSNMNPLLHYILYGRNELRAINSTHAEEINDLDKNIEIILNSGLFDVDFYVQNYLEQEVTEKEAIKHYLVEGSIKNYSANKIFDEEYYNRVALSGFPLKTIRESSLLHYIREGEALGLSVSDKFNCKEYLDANSDLKKWDKSLLSHYIRFGMNEGRALTLAKRLVTIEKSAQNEVKLQVNLKLKRKELLKAIEMINESGLFDHEYYRQQVTYDICDGNEIQDYLENGWKSGLKPNHSFSDIEYLKANEDLQEVALIPFLHYVEHGQFEFRSIAFYPYELVEEDKKYHTFKSNKPTNTNLKIFAFYLPQFHPFPENDEWWGKGFTEWSNVTKAQPNFSGHMQPHYPIHLGYYDLRVPEVLKEQAALARNYGVTGFNFYYYWFDGKVLMEKPFEILLENKDIDIEYCITWANENWTRTWDGSENDILIAQNHSEEDSTKFITHLFKYFNDPRYLRVDNKPVLNIYRADIIPDMKDTLLLWRNIAKKHGFDGLYLVCCQTFGGGNPEDYGFDAAMEFPPHNINGRELNSEVTNLNPEFEGKIYNYQEIASNALKSDEPNYKLFRTCMLSWDNTARKQLKSSIFTNFSLEAFKGWLDNNASSVLENNKYQNDEKLVFINAWNEWAEGTHLEPDRLYGYGALEKVYEVMSKHSKPSNLCKNEIDILFISDEVTESLSNLINWFEKHTCLTMAINSNCALKENICSENIFLLSGNDLKNPEQKIKSALYLSKSQTELLDVLIEKNLPTIVEQKAESFISSKLINYFKFASFDAYFSDKFVNGRELLTLLWESTDLSPRVTVILPSYNHEKFLTRRLESILNQTYQNFELLMLDDFSKDDSVSILESYKNERCSSCLFVNNENSGSPFVQWAKGIELARGELIWIAEDDDFCELNFLEKLVPKFDNQHCKLAYSNSFFIDEYENEQASYEAIFNSVSEGKWYRDYTIPAFEEIRNSLCARNTIPNASAVVFRKFNIDEIIDELKSFKFAGDWFFYLNAISGGEISYVSDKLNYHRRHTTSVMSILQKDHYLYFQELQKIHHYIADNWVLDHESISKMKQYIKDEYTYRKPEKSLNAYYSERSSNEIITKRNIAVFISGYYFGGAEIYPINLANAFAKLGHKVFLVDVGSLDCDLRVKNMATSYVELIDFKGTKNSREDLNRFIENNNIDFINSHGWFAADFIQKNVNDKFSKKWFSCLHGHEENIIQGAWGNEYSDYFEGAFKNAVRLSPTFIYTHDKNLEAFKYYKIKKFNSVCLPSLGMPTELPKKALRSQLGIDKDSFVLGMVARGIPEKGWEQSINAVIKLREQLKHKVDLILIGDSEYVQQLKNVYKQKYIHFLGLTEKVLEWNQVFDVSLLPSYYKSESHPLAIMGHLLCRNPVITTSLGNIPEMLSFDGKQAGKLLKVSSEGEPCVDDIVNSVDNYIRNPKSLEEDSRIAAKAFNKFSMMNVARKYISCFEKKNYTSI